jgi:UTP--glucose-1-phosphate uridylyltransferase
VKKKISKVVITAAGIGARLLPLTKETPKEMLPIYVKSTRRSSPVLKPILHVIFDSVFDSGFNKICFVVGSGKRSIVDHFIVNEKKNNSSKNSELKVFFSKLSKCTTTYVQQPLPKGFGDAVLKSKEFVEEDNFLLHAGDDAILSFQNDHLTRLEQAFFKYDADIALLVMEIEDPRLYGVIEGKILEKNILKVLNFEEKPKRPKSNLASIGIYIFKPKIFKILKTIRPDKKGEVQLADAIKKTIKNKGKVIAVKLKANEKRVDVGTPENYVDCVIESHKFFNK